LWRSETAERRTRRRKVRARYADKKNTVTAEKRAGKKWDEKHHPPLRWALEGCTSSGGLHKKTPQMKRQRALVHRSQRRRRGNGKRSLIRIRGIAKQQWEPLGGHPPKKKIGLGCKGHTTKRSLVRGYGKRSGEGEPTQPRCWQTQRAPRGTSESHCGGPEQNEVQDVGSVERKYRIQTE